MQISSLKIQNYKSFLDSGLIEFGPKFNVIVGENNSGKTALLEALSLRFVDIPHLSQTTVPRQGNPVPSNSRVEVTFKLEKVEILEILKDYFPNFSVPLVNENRKDETAGLFVDWLNGERTIICALVSGNIEHAKFPFEQKIYGNTTVASAFFNMEGDRPRYDRERGGATSAQDLLARKLAGLLMNRVYAFRAERLFVGQHIFGNKKELKPDASNLPEVLNILQGNRSLFDEYNKLLNQVFPTIHHISVNPHDSQQVKIFVNTNPTRDDLAIPLQDSGTGIGQVLALLYIVLTAVFPRTIIIDEPQSFLHPNAIRKLIDVLKQYPNHQYIISTHSPIVISASDPGLLLSIQKSGDDSRVEAVDRAERKQLEKVLGNIGTRLSDVFGADNILWVEGDTEEECFPLVLAELTDTPLLGTSIVGVLSTGDFEGKYSERILRIYKQLSRGSTLLPPAIGFIFDSENKSESEKEKLRKLSRNENGRETVFFLDRRMYENYLLDSEAIASVISELGEETIESETVEKWIEEHKWERELFGRAWPRTEEKRTESTWLEKVHGADLLNSLFRQFLVGIEYNKREYGLTLTKWLIQNKPEALKEIVDLLKLVLKK